MLTRDRNFGTDLVTIEVGPEKKVFHVYKDVLTSASPYFKAAFEGEFREATEKRIYVEDISTSTFEAFMDWLYFRQLPGGNAYEETDSDDEEEKECLYCQGKCCRPPGTTPSTPFNLLTP